MSIIEDPVGVMALLAATVSMAGAVSGSRAVAQLSGGPDPQAELVLPTTWIGTAPPTLEALRGKAVLFYLFEESCPRCKAQWPGLMNLAAKHADDPIAFVAVNSGTPAPLVQRYARSVRLNWPIMVDLDRSFEELCNIGEISLRNIVQVCYITPEGKLKLGQWNDLEGTIAAALRGASWKIDPVEIPDALRVAWRNIEFANYATAAPIVNKALGSRKSEIKTAAHNLLEVVERQAAKDLEAASAEAEKSTYRAYQRYGAIVERYDGFGVVKQAVAARRELARDPALRQELTAIKAIEKQRAPLGSGRTAVRERARSVIDKIIEQHPDSEAARIGRELIGRR